MTHDLKKVSLLFAIVFVGGCGGNEASSDPFASGGSLDGGSKIGAADGGAGPGLDGGSIASPDAGDRTCGLRGGTRGLSSRSVDVGGTTRTYLAYLPATLDASKPAPFVFVFHGYTMSGQQMHDITRYTDIADRDGVAVVFPDGESGPGGKQIQVIGIALCFVIHHLGAIIPCSGSFNYMYQGISGFFSALHNGMTQAIPVVFRKIDRDTDMAV